MPLSLYKPYVIKLLQEATHLSFAAAASSHRVPVTFHDLAQSRILLFKPSDWSQCSWSTLAGHRSLCRLRAGLLEFVHLNQKRSVASIRRCCFCDKKVRTSFMHALGECWVSRSADLPLQWQRLEPADRMRAFLTTGPRDSWFLAVVATAVKLEHLCIDFWQ